MLRNHSNLAALWRTTLAAVFALGFLAQIHAQDEKVSPAGSWTWTVQGRNGGPDRKMTLKLKTEGDKITGTVSTPGRNGQAREAEIKDAKLKGNELTFTVVREINGNTFTSKYNGKITGDTIKGKVETERDGQTRSRDWEAKREVDKK